MRACFKLILFAIGMLAVTVNAISGSSNIDRLLLTIHEQLVQGKVVVVYQMRNDDKNSEQYADWASHLNDFATEHNAYYQFHQATKVVNDNLNSQKINTDGSYTLFLKEGEPSYFYPDVTVEIMVYMAVDHAYAGRLSKNSRIFLPDEIKVRLE